MSKQRVGTKKFSSRRTRSIKKKLIEQYGAVCQLCLMAKRPVEFAQIRFDVDGNNNYAWSIDHIVAIGDGGPNTIDNMWPAHRICNERKGSKAGGSSRRHRVPRREVASGPRLAYTSVSS